ncbi:MAG: isocitrate lyase/PEP mutase family protein [Rhodospirillales bacterium]|nr:isocitrate lyase/PEP mutase family protein [Rhodospirillales bacterium]
MTATDRLRTLLAEPVLRVMPGVFDALSAKIAREAGHPLMFMSGFAVSAARLGQPDAGLVSMGEMLDTLRGCISAAGDVPVLGDGDTGWGNALNVQRTVEEYARAGAAAIMLEDQVSPKKCGHTRGKQVIARDEARLKIRAAVETREALRGAGRGDILILARTDARAVHGFDEALQRCKDFVDEGADIIFLEAPESVEEMKRFCRTIPRPCLANMVFEGKTPVLPAAELQEIGYRLAVYPVVGLTAVIAALRQSFASVVPGSAVPQPAHLTFPELQEAVGFPDYWAREKRFAGD